MVRRYDRTGEPIDVDDQAADAPAAPHHPGCADGWLPETVDGQPVPCLVCRPHLTRLRNRLRRRLEVDPR